jgi:protein-L-isoaspartate(D-aspartate) O-methyltransferase
MCLGSSPYLTSLIEQSMWNRRRWLLGSLAALVTAGPAESEDAFVVAREGMVRDIERLVRATAGYTGRSALAANVIAAMRKVPRHRFVSPDQASLAYTDRPLPIGAGQTISQPFIVALMSDLVEPKKSDVVLEVGTGSGYQAAVLAECVARVYTIEILPSLGERAAALLRELGYTSIETRIGDGYAGWPEAAPFDAIVVTAAPDHVPQPLVDQLKPGGHMVIPVGISAEQDLQVIEKSHDGRTIRRRILPVRFVPLTRGR